MPRQNQAMVEGLVPKIRKRGCSSSSSTSSKVYNYRFKRAILVGKGRNGLGPGLRGSRSSTPVPSWRATPLRNVVESPKQSVGGISQPVSARKLAATLWEMNEMPSPKMTEDLGKKKMMMLKKEKLRALHTGSGSVLGDLPPHLCDPSHSPISEVSLLLYSVLFYVIFCRVSARNGLSTTLTYQVVLRSAYTLHWICYILKLNFRLKVWKVLRL